MQLDPSEVAKLMADAAMAAVAPLKSEIEDLRRQLAEIPVPIHGKDGADGRDGKDCDMEQVKAWIDEAVAAIPAPENGKDGRDGKDGASVTIEDVQPIIERAIGMIRDEAEEAYQKALDSLPVPKDGKDGRDGKDGEKGEKGDPGKDGAGIADLMIDRAGELIATFTDGRMKNLGPVLGKDGRDGVDGKDGQDGIGLDNFDLEYDAGNHEVVIRASANGRTKELRYPAGGIHAGGYWREGNQAKAGQAWTHDGSMWVALRDTKEKPSAQSGNWVLAARRGRDGERGPRGRDAAPAAPIKLGGENESGND